jgi:hypothetical protein
MKRITVTFATLATVAILAGNADAKGVLTAGPISTVSGSTYRCFAVNASTKPVDIKLTSWNFNGILGSTTNCAAVAPGGTCFMDVGSLNYCRVEHTAGKTGVRATLEEFSSGFVPGRTIVAQ